MTNKTCGECKLSRPSGKDNWVKCSKKHNDLKLSDAPQCKTPYISNGDVIRQGGNSALARFKSEHKCDTCAYAAPLDHAPACQRPDGKVCYDGMLAWLNAPAESEGEDE